MNLINIIGIGIGLAMDAFAVSIADGSTLGKLRIRRIVKPALFFGTFQAIMPIIGWSAGNSLYKYVSTYSKYISFILLVLISLKMFYEAYQNEEIDSICDNYMTLIMLSIATSIDALAVGISFALLKTDIITPAIIIGVLTFIICVFGILLGYKIGDKFSKHSAILGATILLIISLKILLT